MNAINTQAELQPTLRKKTEKRHQDSNFTIIMRLHDQGASMLYSSLHD